MKVFKKASLRQYEINELKKYAYVMTKIFYLIQKVSDEKRRLKQYSCSCNLNLYNHISKANNGLVDQNQSKNNIEEKFLLKPD
jgi:hypothetical protein